MLLDNGCYARVEIPWASRGAPRITASNIRRRGAARNSRGSKPENTAAIIAAEYDPKGFAGDGSIKADSILKTGGFDLKHTEMQVVQAGDNGFWVGLRGLDPDVRARCGAEIAVTGRIETLVCGPETFRENIAERTRRRRERNEARKEKPAAPKQ